MHADAEHKTGESLTAEVSHQDDVKDAPIARAILQEHEMTLKHVLVHHKAVAWWCFYWAMCAVGWYVYFACFCAYIPIPTLRWTPSELD